jgi:hypothetical protein
MKERVNKYPVGEIFSAVKRHPAGDSLKNTERYSGFRADESTRVWREILGASANSLEHSELFTRLTVLFIRDEGDKFTQGEKRMLILGASVHDFGEAILDGEGVGDIVWNSKTDETEKEEAEMAHRVISELEITDDLKDELHIAYQEVVEGENTKLHSAFKALEKAEYFMTGMKVFQTSRKREEKGRPLMENEKDIVGKIIVNNINNNLYIYEGEYPNSIGKYMERMIPVVDKAYAFTKSHVKTIDDYEGKIERFEEIWENFQ